MRARSSRASVTTGSDIAACCVASYKACTCAATSSALIDGARSAMAHLFTGGDFGGKPRCCRVDIDAFQSARLGRLDVHHSRIRDSRVAPFADGWHLDLEDARHLSGSAKCVDYFACVNIHAHMLACANNKRKPKLTS